MKLNTIFILILVFLAGFVIGLNLLPQKTLESTSIEIPENQNEITIAGINLGGQGLSGKLITKLNKGTGSISVNINNIIADYTTQYSARSAAKAASNYTNIDLDNLDITYSLIINSSFVSGPSAGAAMAIATAALLQNKTLNQDIVITGSISENGTIEKASSITEKAKAVNDKSLFLVPIGHSPKSQYKEDKFCIVNGLQYCRITYVEKRINYKRELGIQLKEVKNLEEALNYFYEI